MMSELDTITQQGLDLPKPKYDQVTLPPDITELSSEQLAEMFTILTGWADYMASQLVQAQLSERAAERDLDLMTNRLLVEKMGSAAKGDRVTLVKAQISVDERILDLSDKHERRYAYRKILEMMLNNQERDITLVSREITRRSNGTLRRDTFTV
jgi:predicted transcriptional regulator